MRECSTAGWVEDGQAVRVSLFLPDGPWPLRIDQPVGRWVKGREFAVVVVTIRSSVRRRGQRFPSPSRAIPPTVP